MGIDYVGILVRARMAHASPRQTSASSSGGTVCIPTLPFPADDALCRTLPTLNILVNLRHELTSTTRHSTSPCSATPLAQFSFCSCEKVQAGQCNQAVEKLADYLRENGY
eukprot:2509991-Rhodomonas_salina.2